MASQEFPVINGQKHTWSDVRTKVGGVDRRGFTSLSYTSKRTMKDQHGTGPNRVGVAIGPVTHEADAEMYREDFDDLKDSLGGDGFLGVPFQLTASYRARLGARLITDTLNSVRISEVNPSGQEGEDAIKVKLKLNVGEILYNGKRVA